MNVTNITAKGPGRPKDASKGQAILKAASELFLQQGYQGTSMEAVAAAAGVSKLTVYSHYKSKDELFAAAIASVCKSRLPDLMFQLDAHEPLQARLVAIGLAILTLTSSQESIALYRLLMGLSDSESALADLFYQAGPLQVLKAVESLLSQAQARGTLALTNPARAAMHFLNLLNGSNQFNLLLGCCSALPPVTDQEHVEEVVSLFLNAYRV